MRPCTRRIVPAEGIIKATSLNDALSEHAPWCRTAPNALPIHTKPLERNPNVATETQIEVVMPQMGVSVSEGTITKWLKQQGEQVEADESLLEISTDKVDTEVPSPASG